jgi:protein-S-isoprenylcysteine O-methyltransferase Ste14
MPHLTVLQIHNWSNDLWWLLAAVWLGSAPFRKPIARPTSRSFNLTQRLVFFCGLYLLFAPPIAPMLPVLNTPLFTVSLPIAITGLVMVSAGVAFSIWARFTLGTSWSAQPSIRQDHELILRGPYRLVRHPIYTGILTAMLGSAIQLGLLRSLLGFIACAAGLLIKLAVEEQLMVQQFGNRYLEYRTHVRRLVPFLY